MFEVIGYQPRCQATSDLQERRTWERGNLVPRAMPVRGLGWHWLWGN